MLNGPLVSQPEDSQSVATMLRFIQNAISMDIECCLPAIVESYDRTANTATIRPAVMSTVRSSSGGDLIRQNRKGIPDIPVLSMGAGGFHINFPVKPNDLGWIYACDRDISLFLQSLADQPAETDGASHKFSDAIFIPDVVRNYTINEEDAEALVIQSTDGATRISIQPTAIKLTAPTTITIDAPDTIITGNLQIDKNIVVTGPNATLPQATTVGGAAVYGHDHNGQVPPFA